MYLMYLHLVLVLYFHIFHIFLALFLQHLCGRIHHNSMQVFYVPTWEDFYSPCGEPLAGGETRTQVSGTPTLTARAPGGEHACGGQFAHSGKWGTGEADPRRDGMRDVQQSMPAGTRDTNAGSYLEPRRDVPSAGGMDGVNPCYGCGARAPDCHALCPQYADWSRENQAERARRQKQARREYAGVEEAVKRSDKARKKRRNG